MIRRSPHRPDQYGAQSRLLRCGGCSLRNILVGPRLGVLADRQAGRVAIRASIQRSSLVVSQRLHRLSDLLGRLMMARHRG